MMGSDYELLYARFLKRKPEELLELGGMKSGFAVLDLCSGSNARASLAAVSMGAWSVFAVDLNPFVKRIERSPISTFNVDVGDFCAKYEKNSKVVTLFDLVICQQGFNYWANAEILSNLSKIMKKDAKFVFNTSNRKPSVNPTTKEYIINDIHYAEVTQLIDNYVYHTQFAEGFVPHSTSFLWMSHITIMDLLTPNFEKVILKEDGATSIYICSN